MQDTTKKNRNSPSPAAKALAGKTIGFIGGGNMARAIIAGLIDHGVSAESILVANPGQQKRKQLSDDFGIFTTADNREVADQAEIIILSVKPQKMEAALTTMGGIADKLVISVAAGYPLAKLKHILGDRNHYVRAMPNTPALVGEGATGMYTEGGTSSSHKILASEIFESTGVAIWLDNEQQVDLVTAIAGSSPAYFFLMAEAMSAKAVKLGMDEEDAEILILQAMKGAAMLAASQPDSLTELRRKVTSPGGTTQAALKKLASLGFDGIVEAAVGAAFERGQALAAEASD